MARPVVITCDSASDLPIDIQKKYDIRVIPLNININNSDVKDNGSITPDDIYNLCINYNTFPKTAAFSPYEVEQLFDKLVSDGYDVIHISISSELSSCYQNAFIAKGDNEHVFVVDSKNISLGQGLLAVKAAELAVIGLPAQRIYEELLIASSKTHVSFVLNDLDFIHRGGRCSSLTSATANLMQMKISLKVVNGQLKVSKKYRGKIERVAHKYMEDMLDGVESIDGDIALITSGMIDDNTIKDLQKTIKKKVSANIQVYNAGCTISSHCGPGTIGIAYIEK